MDEQTNGNYKTHNQEDINSEIKKEINNLIWMYGHPALTLDRAEKIACDFLQKLQGKL